MVLELIIAATVFVSLLSLLGLAFFFVSKKRLNEILLSFVSLSTGALLGAAFFDLLPDSIAGADARLAMELAFFGMIFSFAIEKIIHWHHHHMVLEGHAQHHKPLGALTLVGCSVHNFFDGVAISAAFIASVPLGFATTLAITFHEIPHEIGDFALLIYSKYSRGRALAFNALTAIAAIAGGVLFYFFSGAVAHLETYALAFTAGMFIYIAGSDLLPELRREKKAGASALQFALLLLGAAIIWLLARYLG